MTIHLQGIGEREAIPAHKVRVGDVMICNFGMTQTVEGVAMSESGKSVFLDIRGESGKLYSRCRYGANRPVAVVRVNGGVV